MFGRLLAVAALAVLSLAPIHAQTWPSKPVRIIVPFPPGGTTDIVARSIGVELQRMWQQSVVIENRAGAGGNIVANAVKGFDASSWFGLFAPAGTPRAVVDRIQADVAKALAQPAVRERFVAQGADPGGNTRDQFAAFIRAETDKWTRVVKFSNAKVD
jgi:tripartite-type tricarboxylate transporter receptor subunit TctC